MKMNATAEPQKPTPSLMSYTSERLSRRQYRSAITAARRQVHSAIRLANRYAGGLPAEIQSAANVKHGGRVAGVQAVREAWANRHGRPIELKLLMAQQHKDGSPVWTIVDPRQEIGVGNGYRLDGYTHIGGVSAGDFDLSTPTNRTFIPGGIPKLPVGARRILQDASIRARAQWIGVLYQPASWTELRPDPAVVVKWKATGAYAALAVWGPDYHRIMEFVS